MRKKIFVVIVVIFIILLSIVLTVLPVRKPTPNNSQQIPTPTPIFPGSTNTTPLRVISTNPIDGTTQIASNQPISISFNNTIATEDLLISSIPPVSFTQEVQKNTLILTPQQPYEDNILYTLTLEDAHSHQVLLSLHFSSGNSPTAIPMQDTNIQTDVDTFDKANHPDVFVANNTPYTANNFSVSASYVDGSPFGHYGVYVSLKTPVGKQDFLSWLHSLGITDSQTESLDIHYQ